MTNKRIIIAITGASGSIYAYKLLTKIQSISNQFHECVVVFSANGNDVWNYELKNQKLDFLSLPNIRIANNNYLFDTIASGSAGYDSMIVVPCSMGTLAKIANGFSNDLISRAADVMLKEKKQLVLVTRESPYSKIHLTNMLNVLEAGATVIPASPYFYHHPQNIDELIEPFVCRIIDKIGLKIDFNKWNI